MSSPADLLQCRIIGLLPKLRRFARSLTRNPHEADDLLQGARERVFEGAEQADGLPDHRGDASGTLSVEQALECLPEDQRLAVALVLIEGLPYKEAAQIIGVPMGTLTSRFARGRQALQELLGPGACA
ncbi:MAG: sigma factor-like helix-turn-helix DNA-binding protein [Steroidobacteraceae bacterium]